mmetsp:Transcript_6361/g.18289  ORF Transcript_6361/g.18289 Transcript_6361/m.18289 type:complete len:204 (+) Transcript_6361:1770-2381(+)
MVQQHRLAGRAPTAPGAGHRAAAPHAVEYVHAHNAVVDGRAGVLDALGAHVDAPVGVSELAASDHVLAIADEREGEAADPVHHLTPVRRTAILQHVMMGNHPVPVRADVIIEIEVSELLCRRVNGHCDRLVLRLSTREDAAPGGIGEGGELLVHLELPLCGVFQRLIALAVPLEECQIPFRDVPVVCRRRGDRAAVGRPFGDG